MSQRYQKEIEEILEQANVESGGKQDAAGQRRTPDRLKPKVARASKRSWKFRLTTGKTLIAGVVLLPLALATGADIFAWLGIGLIVTAYVVYFARPRRAIERRWRGQLIEDEPEPNSLQRVWRWLTRS